MDPITIGLAFTAAQSAVGYIKQAIALGKDINSLSGQFSKFFESFFSNETISCSPIISLLPPVAASQVATPYL